MLPSLLAVTLGQTVLFEDTFDQPFLDRGKWTIADWTFGNNRAFFGHIPDIKRGALQLKLDTFHPTRSGKHMLGTEIGTSKQFAVGNGIALEAKVRMQKLPNGIVFGFFTYASEGPLSDELDFELLTNELNKAKDEVPMLVSTWRDWGKPGHEHGDKVTHSHATVPVKGLDLKKWTTLTIEWRPESVTYLVNGKEVGKLTTSVARRPTNLRLNLWAPGENWKEAYSPDLKISDSPNGAQQAIVEVDSVSVRRL